MKELIEKSQKIINELNKNIFVSFKGDPDFESMIKNLQKRLLDENGKPNNTEYLNKHFTVILTSTPQEKTDLTDTQYHKFNVKIDIKFSNNDFSKPEFVIEHEHQKSFKICENGTIQVQDENDETTTIQDINQIYTRENNLITKHEIIFGEPKKKNLHPRSESNDHKKLFRKKQKIENINLISMIFKENPAYKKCKNLIDDFIIDYKEELSNKDNLQFRGKHAGLSVLLGIKTLIREGLVSDLTFIGRSSQFDKNSELVSSSIFTDKGTTSRFHCIILNNALVIDMGSLNKTIIDPDGNKINKETYEENIQKTSIILDRLKKLVNDNKKHQKIHTDLCSNYIEYIEQTQPGFDAAECETIKNKNNGTERRVYACSSHLTHFGYYVFDTETFGLILGENKFQCNTNKKLEQSTGLTKIFHEEFNLKN